jgi:hypothetical protein
MNTRERAEPGAAAPAAPERVSLPSDGPAATVLRLQRAYGNWAVSAMLARDFTPAPAPGVSPPPPAPPPVVAAPQAPPPVTVPPPPPATPPPAPAPAVTAAPRSASAGDSSELSEDELKKKTNAAKWQKWYGERDMKARSFGAVDYEDFVANMLVAGGSVMGRAVPAGHPVHPLFLDRLEAATAKARAALGSEPFNVGPFGGQDNRPGNHAYGIAIDIVSDANPYVMNEAGEPGIDALTAPVYERIATSLLGRSAVITPASATKKSGLQGASYDRIAEENDAMVAYFSVLPKPEAPAPDPKKKAPPPLSPVQSMSGKTFAADKLAALDVKQVQEDYDLLLGKGAPKGLSGDFPFVRGGPGKLRDPARGFLTIRKEVVEAFRGEGLRWGATDFPGASGDVMHFDDGNRHADYEKYGREHPTAKRQAEAAAPAAPSVARKLARAVLARQPDPQVHPGDGTTDELRAERARLEAERASLHVSTIEPDTEARYNRYTALINRLDVLLAERGNSTLADATIELSFDGRTLSMSGGSTGSWPAVSGRPAAGGSFDNSPARQRMMDQGPIPAGVYWLDPKQLVDLRERWFYSIRYETAWGTHRITIHPFDSTHTFGRGGFFIHGGTSAGSAGCIDLTTNMADFARRLGATPPGVKVKLTIAYP